METVHSSRCAQVCSVGAARSRKFARERRRYRDGDVTAGVQRGPARDQKRDAGVALKAAAAAAAIEARRPVRRVSPVDWIVRRPDDVAVVIDGGRSHRYRRSRLVEAQLQHTDPD